MRCGECGRFCGYDAYRAVWWCEGCERVTRLPATQSYDAPHRPIGALLVAGRGCPDGAKCHHLCGQTCWRVVTCGPLSGAFPDNMWPANVIAANPPDGVRRIEDVLVASEGESRG